PQSDGNISGNHPGASDCRHCLPCRGATAVCASPSNTASAGECTCPRPRQLGHIIMPGDLSGPASLGTGTSPFRSIRFVTHHATAPTGLVGGGGVIACFLSESTHQEYVHL